MKKAEKLYDRVGFIVEVLERTCNTNIYHNYMKVLMPAGKTLPEPQHNFGFLTKDGGFYGGGILESRIFDNDVLKKLSEDFENLIASENLKI